MFQRWFLSIYICSIFANASLLFSGTQCRTKVCATLQIHRKASNLPQSPAELSVPVCAHHYPQKLWLMGWTDVWQRGYSETRQLDIQDGNSPHRNFSDGQVCTLSLKIAGVKGGGEGGNKTNKNTTKQPNTKKKSKNPLHVQLQPHQRAIPPIRLPHSLSLACHWQGSSAAIYCLYLLHVFIFLLFEQWEDIHYIKSWVCSAAKSHLREQWKQCLFNKYMLIFHI